MLYPRGFHRALFPGGGTRLKILEAWAAGVPVVSTATGAAGLEGAVPGTHYLEAESAETSARATVRLLSEPDLARTLGGNARALIGERYDWSLFGKQLSDLLVETCRDRKPSL